MRRAGEVALPAHGAVPRRKPVSASHARGRRSWLECSWRTRRRAGRARCLVVRGGGCEVDRPVPRHCLHMAPGAAPCLAALSASSGLLYTLDACRHASVQIPALSAASRRACFFRLPPPRAPPLSPLNSTRFRALLAQDCPTRLVRCRTVKVYPFSRSGSRCLYTCCRRYTAPPRATSTACPGARAQCRRQYTGRRPTDTVRVHLG
jgi:hypothetical protein